jgi:hypothetical protein
MGAPGCSRWWRPGFGTVRYMSSETRPARSECASTSGGTPVSFGTSAFGRALADREPGRGRSAANAGERDHEGLSRGWVAMTESGPAARR